MLTMTWWCRRFVAALALALVAAPATAHSTTPPPGTADDSPCAGATPPPWYAPGAAHVAVGTPGGRLRVLVAADEPSRERGLMCVLDVPHRSGMIFVFSGASDVPRDFWMKNTLVPLDLVFVAHDGRVTKVAGGVPATTVETPDVDVPRVAGPAHYVIELRAGEAARLHIAPGSRLTIPPIRAS